MVLKNNQKRPLGHAVNQLIVHINERKTRHSPKPKNDYHEISILNTDFGLSALYALKCYGTGAYGEALLHIFPGRKDGG